MDTKYVDVNEIYGRFFNGTNGVARLHVADIDTLPRAEVRPIVRAHWKRYAKQNKWVCTACSFERDMDADFGKAIVCPNCGAIMTDEDFWAPAGHQHSTETPKISGEEGARDSTPLDQSTKRGDQPTPAALNYMKADVIPPQPAVSSGEQGLRRGPDFMSGDGMHTIYF